MKYNIMDHTGHSTEVFDKANKVSVAEAEARFKELTGKGFMAIQPGQNGEPGNLLRKFDPEADVNFQPQLIGG
jgi:hypothetical protein